MLPLPTSVTNSVVTVIMSNSRINPASHQSPTHQPRRQAPRNAYRPSVPISVYRELAGELQQKETQLRSIKAHNQKLLQHNQRLQHEIEDLFLSTQNLQQLASTHDAYGNPIATPPEPVRVVSPPSQSPPSSPTPNLNPPKPPQKQVAEVEERASRRPSQPESSSEVSGWLVGMAIALIVLIAFGTGFLVMRPLLKK